MPNRTSLISLDHPLPLALAPAIGYLVAYLDRLGEALAYGVPTDYIFVSVTDALSRTSLVVVVVALLLLCVRLKTRLEPLVPLWAANAVDTGSTWFLCAAFVFILGPSPRIAGWTFLIGLFYVIVDLGWGFLRRKKKSQPQTGKPVASGIPIVEESNQARASYELPTALLVFLVLCMLVFAFLGGNMRASNRTRYLAVKDDPSTLLLTVYGDNRAVLGVLKANTRELTAERRLVSVPGNSSDFVWIETGAINWPEGLELMPYERMFSIGRKK